MWSFRKSCRGSGMRSRGLKTLLLLDGTELAVHRRDAKGRRFRGHSFFSIKASSLVPSLTDLHLFEPRPSKRRSDEKLDAGTGFAGIGAWISLARRIIRRDGDERKEEAVDYYFKQPNALETSAEKRRETGQSVFIVVIGQTPWELKEKSTDKCLCENIVCIMQAKFN